MKKSWKKKKTAVRSLIRRFRAGLDYTVAHYGGMTAEDRLLATLCLVDEADAAKDTDGTAIPSIWRGGDVGGFECFVVAEEDGAAAAAASAEVGFFLT